MPIRIDIDDLIAYTDWQRHQWFDVLAQRGIEALHTSTGPHGDGRMRTVGEIIRHIFSAEKRYIDLLGDRPITDTSVVSPDDVDALFAFGARSRADLRACLATFPDERLDVVEERSVAGHTRRLTPRKIFVHVVVHEIRHWAQIATLLRLNGVDGGLQDLMLSPVFDQSGDRV